MACIFGGATVGLKEMQLFLFRVKMEYTPIICEYLCCHKMPVAEKKIVILPEEL